jgi:plastocyanin
LVIFAAASTAVLCASAAELKILMHHPDPVDQNGLDRPLLTIDSEDTVTWEVTDNFFTNVQSYTGDWSSPPLTTNGGASYSMTFTQPGLYLYEASPLYPWSSLPVPGAITVLGWTNHPPEISLNDPVEGFVFASRHALVRLDATVRIAETNILQVDFWANSNLIGSLTNPTFSLLWSNFQSGVSYALFARATDKNGTVRTSRNVGIGAAPGLSAYYALSMPRYLADGTFVFYYSVSPDLYWSQYQLVILKRDDLSPGSPFQEGPTINGEGVFFDAFAGAGHTTRFYSVLTSP